MTENNDNFYPLTQAELALSEIKLTDVIKLRLYARAHLIFKSRELGEDELISEALIRTLKGERRWNKKLTILQHLIGVMRSISSDQRRTKTAEAEVLMDDLEYGYNEMETHQDETVLLGTQESVEKIYEVFERDLDVQTVLNGLLAGEKRTETILKSNLSENRYNAARKRITRKTLHMKERGQI